MSNSPFHSFDQNSISGRSAKSTNHCSNLSSRFLSAGSEFLTPGFAFLLSTLFLFGFTEFAYAQQTAEKGSAKAETQATFDHAYEIFPESTVGYLEMDQPSDVVDLIFNHPLKERILEFPEIAEAMRGKEMFQFRAVVALMEGTLEMKWDEAIAFATSGGMAVGFDAKTEGGVIVARSSDGAILEDKVEKLIKLARMEKDIRSQIERVDYRDLDAYKVRDSIIAIVGDSLIVSNKSELAKSVADNILDGSKRSLANNERFVKARQARDESAQAWAFVDMEIIRNVPEVKKALSEKAENLVVELALGGLQSVVQKTDHLSGELFVSNDAVRLALHSPSNPDWIPDTRAYFFGADGKATAPALIVPDNAVLNLTTHRDLAEWWLAKEELLREKDIAELAQANTVLTTLFGNLDFGEDVLGSLKPGMQVVAAEQDFSKTASGEPELKLPSFAVILQMKDTKAVQRRFKVGFQTLVGFLNIQLGQQNMPQLDVETRQYNGAQIVTATYLPEEDGEVGLINYNFSPTIAFVEDYFVISSTIELANEIVDQSKFPTAIKEGTNTLIEIDGKVLMRLLEQNRETLISTNMLEQGNERKDAEKEIGMLLAIAEMFDGAGLKLTSDTKSVDLEVELRVDAK